MILADVRKGVSPAPPAVSSSEAALDLYRRALDEDDRLRSRRIVTMEDMQQTEAWRSLNQRSATIYLHSLRAITQGSLSGRDWLDGEKHARRQALHQLVEDTTKTLGYDDANLAFLHAEMEANDTFIDATIGWAITEACRGKTAPVRGSKEWIELARPSPLPRPKQSNEVASATGATSPAARSSFICPEARQR